MISNNVLKICYHDSIEALKKARNGERDMAERWGFRMSFL
jgi:hypothetical protein